MAETTNDAEGECDSAMLVTVAFLWWSLNELTPLAVSEYAFGNALWIGTT